MALYKNKLFFFGLLVLCLKYDSFPQVYPDSAVHHYLNNGIRHLINNEYGSAEKNFTELNKNYPKLPLGNIYLAVLEIVRAYDYGESFPESKIEMNMKKGLLAAENIVHEQPGNIWNIYSLALAKGCAAYYNQLNGNFFAAAVEAFDAISYFKKCISLDPSFFEAYAPVGIFKYWLSEQTKFIHWLPFFEDESKEAVKFLETARNSSKYNSALARNLLAWIYIDAGAAGRAIETAVTALEIYPKSRFFKWVLAKAYTGVNNTEPIRLYSELLSEYESIRLQSNNNITLLKFLLAQEYAAAGDTNSAMKELDDILKLKIPETELEKLAGRIEKVKKFKGELSKQKH